MRLRHIHSFQRDIDIAVERIDGKLKISITEGEKNTA
jgi:hypothetical protein